LKTLEEYENKFPLNLKNNLNTIFEEILKLPSFKNDIIIQRKKFSFYSDKKILAPQLSVEEVQDFFINNTKFNTDKTKIGNLQENIIVLWRNYSNFLLNGMNITLEFQENKKWENFRLVAVQTG